MNTSAMKRVLVTLPDAFGAFLYLREKFFSERSRKPLRFVDLWRLSTLAVALPRFLLWRRAPSMQEEQLPAYIADINKFSAGVNSLMLELALREATCREVSDLPEMTPEGLFDLADAMLVGEREVCAAPPTLVVEALRAFIDGKVGFKTSLPSVQEAIADLPALFGFAAAYADQQIFRWLLTSLHDCLVYDIAGGQTGWRPAGEHASELSMLAAIRSGILHSPPIERSILVIEVARRMLSQAGLLAKLATTLEALSSDDVTTGRGNSQLERTMRSNTAAARTYLTFRTAALDTLSTLESALRAPLGIAPVSGPGRVELFTLVVGCSFTT